MRKTEMLICLGNIAINILIVTLMSVVVYLTCSGTIGILPGIMLGLVLIAAYVAAEFAALAACCSLRKWQVSTGMAPGDFT